MYVTKQPAVQKHTISDGITTLKYANAYFK